MTIISNSQQFIFVHLHKCAGTSIEKALEKYLEWNDILLGSTQYGEEIQIIYRKKFDLTKHSSAQTIRSTVGEDIWNEYQTFSFVRHPLDRMVSLYEYFRTYYLKGFRGLFVKSAFSTAQLGLLPPFIANEATVKLPFKWPGVKATITSRNFSEFIRSKYLGAAPAARSQFSQLSDSENNKLIVDYVGKVETINKDWDYISEKLGIRTTNLSNSNHSVRKYQQWRSYYSLDDINFMITKYKDDMEAFNYKV